MNRKFQTLEGLQDILESLAHEVDASFLAHAQFQNMLYRIIDQEPLQPIDFIKSIRSIDDLPEPTKKMLDLIQEGFKLQPKVEMMSESLQKFVTECNKLWPGSFMSQLLINEASRWLDKIQSHIEPDQKASLSVYLAPSLSLDEKEEWVEQSIRHIKLPVALANTGRLPAMDVRLQIINPDKNINFKTLNLKPSGEREEDEIKVKTAIGGGETDVFFVGLNHIFDGSVQFQPRYENLFFPTTDPDEMKSLLDVHFPIPKSIGTDGFINPYLPDVPLPPGSELMKGKEHRDIVDNAISSLKSEANRILVVRGLKRTGKTTILAALKRRLVEEKSYFPIYIDLYMWWYDLSRKSETIDDVEKLFYELADSAIRDAFEVKDDTIAEENYLSGFKKTMSMNQKNFVSFLNILSNRPESKLKIVFLIDEIDCWIHAGGDFKAATQALMVHLNALARNNICSTILTKEWTSREWEKELQEVTQDKNFEPLKRDVKFLKKTDLEDLVKLGPWKLHLTNLAFELIWRVTGGWPGLAQLVLYRLAEEAQLQAREGILVDTEMVRKIIRKILTSSDNLQLIDYLLKSIDHEEMVFLRKLYEKNLIRKQTSQIDGIRYRVGSHIDLERGLKENLNEADLYHILRNLEGKEIIERRPEDNDRFLLRVGLLSYPEIVKRFLDGGNV